MTSTELEIFKQSILDEVRVMMQVTGQVTQYIGARYVPLFADPLDWSNAMEYEPLTIVLHQGNSFTSRQFVPKGIDISDKAFWANTGNYNAQVEQYRQEVLRFDGRITTAQSTADEALNKINSLAPIVTDGIYLCLGDSWVAGGEIANIIARQKNLQLVNKAVSGASFTEYSSYVSTVSEQIDAAAAKINNHNLVKLITVVCSVNDVTHHSSITQTQINTAFANTMKKIKRTFPAAEIIFAADAPYSSDFQSLSYYYYNVSQLQIASAYQGVTFINLIGMFNNKDMYKDDNLHPNTAGYGFVAYMLMGGNYIAQNIIRETHDDDSVSMFINGNEIAITYNFAAGAKREFKFDRFFAFWLNYTMPRSELGISYRSENCATVDYKNIIEVPTSNSPVLGTIYGTLI